MSTRQFISGEEPTASANSTYIYSKEDHSGVVKTFGKDENNNRFNMFQGGAVITNESELTNALNTSENVFLNGQITLTGNKTFPTDTIVDGSHGYINANSNSVNGIVEIKVASEQALIKTLEWAVDAGTVINVIQPITITQDIDLTGAILRLCKGAFNFDGGYLTLHENQILEYISPIFTGDYQPGLKTFGQTGNIKTAASVNGSNTIIFSSSVAGDSDDLAVGKAVRVLNAGSSGLSETKRYYIRSLENGNTEVTLSEYRNLSDWDADIVTIPADASPTLQLQGFYELAAVKYISDSVNVTIDASLDTGITIVEVDTTNDRFRTATPHGLTQGRRVQFENSGGSLPTGLVASTDYWIIAYSETEFSVMAAHQDPETTPVSISSSGSGTNTVRAYKNEIVFDDYAVDLDGIDNVMVKFGTAGTTPTYEDPLVAGGSVATQDLVGGTARNGIFKLIPTGTNGRFYINACFVADVPFNLNDDGVGQLTAELYFSEGQYTRNGWETFLRPSVECRNLADLSASGKLPEIVGSTYSRNAVHIDWFEEAHGLGPGWNVDGYDYGSTTRNDMQAHDRMLLAAYNLLEATNNSNRQEHRNSGILILPYYSLILTEQAPPLGPRNGIIGPHSRDTLISIIASDGTSSATSNTFDDWTVPLCVSFSTNIWQSGDWASDGNESFNKEYSNVRFDANKRALCAAHIWASSQSIMQNLQFDEGIAYQLWIGHGSDNCVFDQMSFYTHSSNAKKGNEVGIYFDEGTGTPDLTFRQLEFAQCAVGMYAKDMGGPFVINGWNGENTALPFLIEGTKVAVIGGAFKRGSETNLYTCSQYVSSKAGVYTLAVHRPGLGNYKNGGYINFYSCTQREGYGDLQLVDADGNRSTFWLSLLNASPVGGRYSQGWQVGKAGYDGFNFEYFDYYRQGLEPGGFNASTANLTILPSSKNLPYKEGTGYPGIGDGEVFREMGTNAWWHNTDTNQTMLGYYDRDSSMKYAQVAPDPITSYVSTLSELEAAAAIENNHITITRNIDFGTTKVTLASGVHIVGAGKGVTLTKDLGGGAAHFQLPNTAGDHLLEKLTFTTNDPTPSARVDHLGIGAPGVVNFTAPHSFVEDQMVYYAGSAPGGISGRVNGVGGAPYYVGVDSTTGIQLKETSGGSAITISADTTDSWDYVTTRGSIGIQCDVSDVTVRDCKFLHGGEIRNNSAYYAPFGARTPAADQMKNIRLEDCTFLDNDDHHVHLWNVKGGHMRGCRFDTGTETDNGGNFVRASALTDYSFEGCDFRNGPRMAIEIFKDEIGVASEDGSKMNRISNCNFQNMGSFSISISNNETTAITNCTFRDSSAYGVAIEDGADNTTVSNCAFYNMYKGINVNDNPGNATTNFSFTNCVFDGIWGENVIKIYRGTDGIISNCSIKNHTYDPAGGDKRSIFVQQSDRVHCFNNNLIGGWTGNSQSRPIYYNGHYESAPAAGTPDHRLCMLMGNMVSPDSSDPAGMKENYGFYSNGTNFWLGPWSSRQDNLYGLNVETFDYVESADPADTPTPTNGSAGNAPGGVVSLSWNTNHSGHASTLYFGETNPPPLLNANQTTESQTISGLTTGVYYWRVDQNINDEVIDGPLWNFTITSL